MQQGKVLPAALNAKKRGVMFDVGHGGGSFDYTVAEAAIAQGCPPDTISSDIHVFSGNTPGMPYLTWVMSKFLNMGFTLEQVVSMATANPAMSVSTRFVISPPQLHVRLKPDATRQPGASTRTSSRWGLSRISGLTAGKSLSPSS